MIAARRGARSRCLVAAIRRCFSAAKWCLCPTLVAACARVWPRHLTAVVLRRSVVRVLLWPQRLRGLTAALRRRLSAAKCRFWSSLTAALSLRFGHFGPALASIPCSRFVPGIPPRRARRPWPIHPPTRSERSERLRAALCRCFDAAKCTSWPSLRAAVSLALVFVEARSRAALRLERGGGFYTRSTRASWSLRPTKFIKVHRARDSDTVRAPCARTRCERFDRWGFDTRSTRGAWPSVDKLPQTSSRARPDKRHRAAWRARERGMESKQRGEFSDIRGRSDAANTLAFTREVERGARLGFFGLPRERAHGSWSRGHIRRANVTDERYSQGE